MKMVEQIKHVQNLQVKVFSANSPSPDLNPLKPPPLPFFSCSFLNLSSDSVSLCFQVFTFKNKFQQRLWQTLKQEVLWALVLVCCCRWRSTAICTFPFLHRCRCSSPLPMSSLTTPHTLDPTTHTTHPSIQIIHPHFYIKYNQDCSAIFVTPAAKT